MDEKSEKSEASEKKTSLEEPRITMRGPLRWLAYAAVPAGYFANTIQGPVSTQLIALIVAALLVVSSMTSWKNGRAFGLVYTLVWIGIGYLFFLKKGI